MVETIKDPNMSEEVATTVSSEDQQTDSAEITLEEELDPAQRFYEVAGAYMKLLGKTDLDPYVLTQVVSDMEKNVEPYVQALTPGDTAAEKLVEVVNYISSLSTSVDQVYDSLDKASQDTIWSERNQLIGKLNTIRMALERRLGGREWHSDPDPNAN